KEWDNPSPVNPNVMSRFTIVLYEHPYPVVVTNRPPAPQRDPLLWARFQFNLQTQELLLLTIGGPFVDERRQKLSEEVDQNPQWSDERVVQELKRAGAKFGPNDREEFLRELPLKNLEPFTGRLEVVSADFNIRSEPFDDDVKPEALLSWRVEAKWHSANGSLQ